LRTLIFFFCPDGLTSPSSHGSVVTDGADVSIGALGCNTSTAFAVTKTLELIYAGESDVVAVVGCRGFAGGDNIGALACNTPTAHAVMFYAFESTWTAISVEADVGQISSRGDSIGALVSITLTVRAVMYLAFLMCKAGVSVGADVGCCCGGSKDHDDQYEGFETVHLSWNLFPRDTLENDDSTPDYKVIYTPNLTHVSTYS
jgi:hypothetical protein